MQKLKYVEEVENGQKDYSYKIDIFRKIQEFIPDEWELVEDKSDAFLENSVEFKLPNPLFNLKITVSNNGPDKISVDLFLVSRQSIDISKYKTPYHSKSIDFPVIKKEETKEEAEKLFKQLKNKMLKAPQLADKLLKEVIDKPIFDIDYIRLAAANYGFEVEKLVKIPGFDLTKLFDPRKNKLLDEILNEGEEKDVRDLLLATAKTKEEEVNQWFDYYMEQFLNSAKDEPHRISFIKRFPEEVFKRTKNMECYVMGKRLAYYYMKNTSPSNLEHLRMQYKILNKVVEELLENFNETQKFEFQEGLDDQFTKLKIPEDEYIPFSLRDLLLI